MNLMSSSSDYLNLLNKIQENITSLKQFLVENIHKLQEQTVSSVPLEIKLFDKIQFSSTVASNETATDIANRTISGSVGASKEFIQNNRKQIISILSRLAGLTLSATVSYFLFKWLMKNLDPTNADKLGAKTRAEKIIKEIGLNKNVDLNEYELCIASNIVLPKSIDCSWQDIGGLEHIIQIVVKQMLPI